MRGSDIYRDRDLDEYEEDEQYEEYEEEEEAEYEEEEPQLTKDQIEYLERRQKLKEIERQKMKKNGLVMASAKEKAPARDSFGSFFGPSQPVVAKRVIEESRAMLDLHLISAGGQKAPSQNKNARHVPNVNTKSTESKQPFRPVNQVKTKIEKLREARDYSFLLSGDAEFPAPAKEPAVQKKPIPSSDARPSQMAAKWKPLESKKPANLLNAVHDRKPTVSAGRSLPKMNAKKGVSASKLKSSGGRTMLPTGNARNGERKGPTSNDQNVESRKLPASNVKNGELRRLPATTAGNGPGRPMLDRKKAAHATIQNVPSGSASKTSLHKQQIAVQKRPVEQGKHPQRSEKATAKMTSLRPTSSMSAKVAAPRPAALKQQNGKISKQLPSQPMNSSKTKKRPADGYSDEDDGGNYRSLIRQMFRYDPRKYRGDDEDDSDMEVGFDRIEAEERRSARIAKEEDERELALIQEEERREFLRREAKRLKLKHSQR